MVLEPEIVRIAVNLHEDGWPAAETDKDLACLFGTREELLAYLFTRTDFLRKHLDILKAARELAESHGSQMETNRPDVAMPAKARDLSSEIREVTSSIAEHEIAASGTKQRFDALERQHALYSTEALPFVNAPERWFSP